MKPSVKIWMSVRIHSSCNLEPDVVKSYFSQQGSTSIKQSHICLVVPRGCSDFSDLKPNPFESARTFLHLKVKNEALSYTVSWWCSASMLGQLLQTLNGHKIQVPTSFFSCPKLVIYIYICVCVCVCVFVYIIYMCVCIYIISGKKTCLKSHRWENLETTEPSSNFDNFIS